MAYGLVLGGGGAKGGYEIGVWKALRELNIPICAVCGTSVGALNGALIVQDEFEKAFEIWTSITMDTVIKLEGEIATSQDGENKISNKIRNIKAAIKSGGLDVTPLKMLIDEVVDEDKIRNSDIDFGLVTFSLSDLKPVEVFKDEIPYGKLKDYLLASACFPAFKPYEIDNKKFIDGGVYNNIPVSMMRKKGIKDIIVVDVSGIGITQRTKYKDCNIIKIKNSEDLGRTLNFDSEKSKSNIEIGYLDTLKAFKKVVGYKYYIKNNNEGIGSSYIGKLDTEDFKNLYRFLGLEWGRANKNNKIIIDKILRVIQQYTPSNLTTDSVILAMAEITAEQLGINRRRVYELDELIDVIYNTYNEIKTSSDFNEYVAGLKKLILSRNEIEFDREMKKVFMEAKFLLSFYPGMQQNEDIKRFRRLLSVFMPKVVVANLFISLILQRKGVEV
ncbi:MAG: patatin-like phospholipase family protein [Caloramator sp.]|jgi:NTE family protein|uniref:patatin-like phospholipase family protein n=1 Tax=Caloramator sp. TaxID=1871330 RepID=UPI001DED7F6F|nr:patatin-like phospholipase family protein [Caloramator sp.]MBZ4664530.1 patatin-like phospholipase family protein [Caloramator sp.]